MPGTRRPPPRRNGDNADGQELPDYCARPECRREFRRTLGPGRRQAFCSEICRRTAEKELRQVRARLQHFETIVDQLRVDVAAFDRGEREAASPRPQASQWMEAVAALARAAGVLSVANPDTPLLGELQRLHDAVAPLLTELGRTTAAPARA